jgi:DNA-binding XRE family transcriptional regulator
MSRRRVKSPPRTELAELRRRSGRSQAEFATAVEVSVQTIRAWEQGWSTPLPRHRRPIAEVLGRSLAEIDRIIDRRPPDLNGHALDVTTTGLNLLVKAEQGASKVQVVDVLRLPALVQTRDYALAVEQTYPFTSTVAIEMDRSVDQRLARQAVLRREPDPLELTALIPRWVLGRIRGTRRIMADQLDHLLDLVEQPNIDIRILPDSPGVVDIPSSLTIVTGHGSTTPDLVGTDGPVATTYIETTADVAALVSAFDRLDADALNPADSANIIHTQRKDYWT